MSPEILLTNDDGIRSPGLWAAAQALSALGFVHVAAPREQYSGAGHSMPSTSDGRIETLQVQVNGQNWQVYAVGGSPAQTVQHATLEILPERPSLVVSGINYGENLGLGVTASGTVGAAIEGAAQGIPALAVSLETDLDHHLSYSPDVDFSAASYFTALFARLLLEQPMPADVHLLKVDVPRQATQDTPWKITHLSRLRYFQATASGRQALDQPAPLGYRLLDDASDDPGGDIYTVRAERCVSVTPLSLDLTSRTDLQALEKSFRRQLS